MRTDRLNNFEVVVGDPSPMWTEIRIDGKRIASLGEHELMDLHLLLGRAVEHIRATDEEFRRDGKGVVLSPRRR